MPKLTDEPCRMPVWAARAVPLAALLGAALGGATELWSQAAVLAACGLLFLGAPPQRSLGWFGNLLCAALLLLALSAFLPAAWFPPPPWREVLVRQFGVALPMTRSPQPWLSLEAGLLLLSGVAWGYYLCAVNWPRQERGLALRIFAAGAILLAGVALAAHFAHFKVPLWPPVGNSNIDFGFFPNRNQTGHVLALSGVVLAALALADWPRRRGLAILWLSGFAAVATGLVLTTSRGAILLLFAGFVLWLAGAVPLVTSGKPLAFTVTAIILLLCGFFIFGGEALRRFQPGAHEVRGDFRLLLQRDALALTAQAPWIGSGLGNFEPLFATVRARSVAQNRVIHPESDWVWAAVELGWLAPAALLAALGWWLGRCFPFERETRSAVRWAALVCGLGFAGHGLVDVSAHRVGSAWIGLFLMSLALRRGGGVRAGWVAPVFRGLGLLLLAVSACWLLSVQGVETFPTSASLARQSRRAEAAAQTQRPPRVLAATTEALRIAPLDWRFYLERAVYEAWSDEDAALRDFRLARFLQPHWLDARWTEAGVWLARREAEKVLEPLAEIVERVPGAREDVYRLIARAGPQLPDGGESLRIWARGQPGYLLATLREKYGPEFLAEADAVLARDPHLLTLSETDRRSFLQLWAARGDPARFAAWLETHPPWIKEHAAFLAAFYAQAGDYERAWQTAEQFVSKPALPKLVATKNLPAAEREYVAHPHDLARGLVLYAAQRATQQPAAAARTLGKLEQEAGAPPYLWYLEAQFHAERQDWEKAWQAWAACRQRAG